MNAKWHPPSPTIFTLMLAALLTIGSSALLGCVPQPQSMFEQQAEADSANEIDSNSSQQMAIIAPITPATADNTSLTPIHIAKQQSIAQRSNCAPTLSDCQYFELNTLSFNPAQPWLTRIMWQTIARVLAPETPLSSQDETAKNIVSRLFNQIEYSEQMVDTLPMYQRIDTELILNPVLDSHLNKGSAHNNDLSDSKTGEKVDATLSARDSITTGYLVVKSHQRRGVKDQQQLNYVMLDMRKKLQLTIGDILLAQVTTDALLPALETAKRDWLAIQDDDLQDTDLQNSERNHFADSPLALSKQWYLDAKGLHMVYQSGERLDIKTAAVDLVIPYALLQGLVNPRYIVQMPLASKP